VKGKKGDTARRLEARGKRSREGREKKKKKIKSAIFSRERERRFLKNALQGKGRGKELSSAERNSRRRNGRIPASYRREKGEKGGDMPSLFCESRTFGLSAGFGAGKKRGKKKKGRCPAGRQSAGGRGKQTN